MYLFTLNVQWKKNKFCGNLFRTGRRTKYRMYHKYLDILPPYHTYPKIGTSAIYYLLLCLQNAGWVANSADPDETPRSAASHLGLHCFLRLVCPNTYNIYGSRYYAFDIFRRVFYYSKWEKKWLTISYQESFLFCSCALFSNICRKMHFTAKMGLTCVYCKWNFGFDFIRKYFLPFFTFF